MGSLFTSVVFVAASFAGEPSPVGVRTGGTEVFVAPFAGDPLTLDSRMPVPPGCYKRPLEQGRGNVVVCPGGIL